MLPIIAFLTSFVVFAAIGAWLLHRSGRGPVQAWQVAVFAFAGQLGTMLFATGYGHLFASDEGRLRTRLAAIGFVVGVLLAGVAAGLLVTRLVTYATQRRSRR